MDNRAQSIGIARFILSLMVGAVVVWIVNAITNPILDGAHNTTSNASYNQATTWLGQAVDWLPIAFLLIATMGLVVYAIYVREVKR